MAQLLFVMAAASGLLSVWLWLKQSTQEDRELMQKHWQAQVHARAKRKRDLLALFRSHAYIPFKPLSQRKLPGHRRLS
jgi:hypothetical protein